MTMKPVVREPAPRSTLGIETEHPGYLGSQDTFYVDKLVGVGRLYQQTFIDTYCKVAFCKLYTTKTPITAADLLDDKVLPFFEENDFYSSLCMLLDDLLILYITIFFVIKLTIQQT